MGTGRRPSSRRRNAGLAIGKKSPGGHPARCWLDPHRQSLSPRPVLLFKRILDFQKSDGGLLDKRGAKRYPVGAKFPLKAKITLSARDGEGHLLPADKSSPMDWGGQLLNLSSSGVSIRMHPSAVAAKGENCTMKLELDHKLFELSTTIAYYRVGQQFVSCGVVLNFPDSYARKAYLQLMEPVAIGSSLEVVAPAKVKQDLPGLLKEQYLGESETVLSVWRDSGGKNPKLFEFIVHDFCIRGNTEMPGLKITYRDGAAVGKRVSRPAVPLPLSADHQAEVRQLFQFIIQNLGKGVPSELKKFLELFAD